MARSITLTLGAGLSSDLGPNFNLTADTGVVTPSTAIKVELLAGKIVSVDDAATQVTITSTGLCTNSITQVIPCVTTTTTTTAYVPVGLSTPFTTVAVSRTTGQYQVAGNSNFNVNPWVKGYIFISNNYGANWLKTSLYGAWQKVAVSDNGQYMLAVEYYGKAYRSSNYGTTWTQITNFPYPAPSNPYSFPALQTLNFRGAALSDNGQYQAICTSEDLYGTDPFGFQYFYNTIFVSNDYGATWTARNYEQNQDGVYNAVTISANGQIVLAAKGRLLFGLGTVVRSTNYGVNWAEIPATETAGNLVDIGITANGTYAISARYSNDYFPYLIKSTDGGATWSNVTGGGGAAQAQWTDVAVNTNAGQGAYAIASTNSTSKYIQSVYLLTTVMQLTPGGLRRWRCVGNSDDGQYVLAGTTAGLFKSSNSGVSWIQVS